MSPKTEQKTAAEVAAEVNAAEPEATEGARPRVERKRRAKTEDAPEIEFYETPDFWGGVVGVFFAVRAKRTGYADYALSEVEARAIGEPVAKIFTSLAAKYCKKNPELAAAVAAVTVIGQALVIREQGLRQWREQHKV